MPKISPTVLALDFEEEVYRLLQRSPFRRSLTLNLTALAIARYHEQAKAASSKKEA